MSLTFFAISFEICDDFDLENNFWFRNGGNRRTQAEGLAKSRWRPQERAGGLQNDLPEERRHPGEDRPTHG